MSFQSETIREVSCKLDNSGRYDDISLLRESRRGRIFSATRNGRRLILKAVASDALKDIEALKREYETSVTLTHPFIANIFTYESGSPVGPCIVMEYVDGRPLGEWLAEAMPASLRRRVFAQLLDAVEYLHGKGVVHNDLSPENILVTRSDNSVKIIDFGFADDDMHYLGKGRGCTRQYASPELLAGEPTDARSDIYSLGLLMRDLFGRRFHPVASRAAARDPRRRFASVAAMRKAWRQAERLPAVLAAAALLATILLLSIALLSVKKHQREQSQELQNVQQEQAAAQQEQAARRDTLASLKQAIDEWYAAEVPAAQKKIEDSASFQDAFGIWEELSDNYAAFWPQIYSKCPEELSPQFADWLNSKLISDFPPPPSQK